MPPTLTLRGPRDTERLARAIAPRLGAGDLVGLVGDLGAGKSVFARALIGARLAALGRDEPVPSPTYTLVQVYDLGAGRALARRPLPARRRRASSSSSG